LDTVKTKAMAKEIKPIVPVEQIMSRIFLIREEKVMLDVHLAELYGVETRALKQAVRRNTDLFPSDFMFVLSDTEVDIMVSQNVIPSKQHLGGSSPFAFTETGVAMLSSVLKSKRAKEMNIAIMRAFVALRKVFLNHTEMKLEIEEIKKKLQNQDNNIELVFSYLDELMEKQENPTPRKQIGFRVNQNK
jgi:hypothetical protein